MTRSAAPAAIDAEHFGRAALGPILAEFCLRLWLFDRFLPEPNDATLLFCARGGLRLKLAYEHFIKNTGLSTRLPAHAFMVSRLVAARTAIVPPQESVLAELAREFAGRPMCEVALALAQQDDLVLSPDWQAPFQAALFAKLLQADDPGAAALRIAMAKQDRHFQEHLAACTDGRRHGILIDTGLYGSTVRMLREGVPGMRWSSLLFARSNYKQLPTPHFDCTVGVSVESDVYKPWAVRTSALRFWHLIEAALEPDLPSVRVFEAGARKEPPRSNLQVADWQSRVAPQAAGIFAGTLSYLDDLSPSDLHRVSEEATTGWRLFKRCVVWPDAHTLTALDLADRSRDFGRQDRVAQFSTLALPGSFTQIRASLWREGALIRSFPSAGRLGLPFFELAHAGRSLKCEADTWRNTRRGR